MPVHFFKPSNALAPFIETYLIFEDDGALKDLPLNIVPSGLSEIAVHYGDPCDSYLNYPGEVKGGYLYGPHSTPGYFMARGKIKCLCVLFRPYGAFRIFGHPQVEFRNYGINLEDMCGVEGVNVIEQISLAETPIERVIIMDAFLLRCYKKSTERPVDIDGPLDFILRSNGRIKIRNICSQLDLNIRTLERRFKNILGLTPKEFSSIVRLNSAYKFIKEKNPEDIQDIVFKCGYYDQSHFINEFKNYTCITPDVILKEPDNHIIYLNRMYTY